MLSGRFPSWLSASLQVLVPLMDVFSGVWVFVTVNPVAAVPLTAVVYPVTVPTSSTV